MGNNTVIGEFEQLVALAILRLGEEAYSRNIRREIEERTGRKVSRGAVYTTLDRLENKGFLSSFLGKSRPVKSGKARRYYQVEPDGIDALQESQKALQCMWAGLEPILGRS